jgi:hypothetical protein
MEPNKKPETVEAHQWLGNNYMEMADFLKPRELNVDDRAARLYINTGEEILEACALDWVVVDPNGAVSLMDPKVFENDYARAADRTIVKYTHHGREVFVRADLKGNHREHCLCFSCFNFKPGDSDNCPVAQQVYKTCVDFNLVTPVWECPQFVQIQQS